MLRLLPAALAIAALTSNAGCLLDDADRNEEIGSIEQAVTTVTYPPGPDSDTCFHAAGPGCCPAPGMTNCWDDDNIWYDGQRYSGRTCKSHAVTREHDQCYRNCNPNNLPPTDPGVFTCQHDSGGYIASGMECDAGPWPFNSIQAFEVPEHPDFGEPVMGLGTCYMVGRMVEIGVGAAWCKCTGVRDLAGNPFNGGTVGVDIKYGSFEKTGSARYVLDSEVIFTPPYGYHYPGGSTDYCWDRFDYYQSQGKRCVPLNDDYVLIETMFEYTDYGCDRQAVYEAFQQLGLSDFNQAAVDALEGWAAGDGGAYDMIIKYPHEIYTCQSTGCPSSGCGDVYDNCGNYCGYYTNGCGPTYCYDDSWTNVSCSSGCGCTYCYDDSWNGVACPSTCTGSCYEYCGDGKCGPYEDSYNCPSDCGGGGGGDSCYGNCGSFAGSCYCDSACTSYGDCCSDYDYYCGDGGGKEPIEPY